MERLVHINGKLVPTSQATISVFDHGLLYGDGVFEGIRAYKGKVFRLREHLQRLYRSAHIVGLQIPMTMEDMQETVLECLRVNDLSDAYIRLVVTRGVGDLGLDPRKCYGGPTTIIIADSIELYPPELYEKGLEIMTVTTRRNLPAALSPSVKSLNYLNNILAKMEVNRAGLHEGLMLNHEGYVAEATGDNVFFFDGIDLVTPPPSVGILVGITRGVVMEIAADMGMIVREERFLLHDIYTAQECFLTGTAAEIIPVVRVDGRTIGDGKSGKVTRELMARFRQRTLEEGAPIREQEPA